MRDATPEAAWKEGYLPSFEQFAASAAWRALPLRIKVMLLHLRRSELERAQEPTSDQANRSTNE